MKSFLTKLVRRIQSNTRNERAVIFKRYIDLSEHTKLLDIGSEDGSHIQSVLTGTAVRPENIYIADINAEVVERGNQKYAFNPVVIPESGKLPFADAFFDVVYCSSVIEHVTIPKSVVWTVRRGKDFRELAWNHQCDFAKEISRLGKQYFVHTPNKYFPIESHTWLPFAGYLPRQMLVPLLSLSNKYWVKKTTPDWHLLSLRQIQVLFPDAQIVRARFLGLDKGYIAIRGKVGQSFIGQHEKMSLSSRN